MAGLGDLVYQNGLVAGGSCELRVTTVSDLLVKRYSQLREVLSFGLRYDFCSRRNKFFFFNFRLKNSHYDLRERQFRRRKLEFSACLFHGKSQKTKGNAACFFFLLS